jgi:hypothetical protein
MTNLINQDYIKSVRAITSDMYRNSTIPKCYSKFISELNSGLNEGFRNNDFETTEYHVLGSIDMLVITIQGGKTFDCANCPHRNKCVMIDK